MKPHAGVSTLLDIPQSKVVPFPVEPMLLAHYERGEEWQPEPDMKLWGRTTQPEPDVHAELLRSAKAARSELTRYRHLFREIAELLPERAA